MGRYAGRALRYRRPPQSVANGRNRGPFASRGMHCTPEPSRSACAARGVWDLTGWEEDYVKEDVR